jgi:hypothetical protein
MTTTELTITLRKPVELGGETYSVLRVRELTGDELVELDGFQGTAADVVAVSRASGVPQAAVRKIAASAFTQAADFIADCLKVPDDLLKGGAAADELVLPLRKPVALDDRQVTELKLREPTAGELEAFNRATGWARDIAAVAAVTGIPSDAAGKILGGDLKRAMRFIESFLHAAPTTGGK